MPTFEEYEREVKDLVQDSLKRCADKDELQRYLVSDTVNDEIKIRYPEDVEDYKNGRFPSTAWEDAEASVAYCLYMMYEE